VVVVAFCRVDRAQEETYAVSLICQLKPIPGTQIMAYHQCSIHFTAYCNYRPARCI